MNKTKKITAIVCAYNEQDTVFDVVNSLMESPLTTEVIVINDGSTDKTSSVLKKLPAIPKLKIIEFETNRGKGWAMAEGITAASGEIIVFVDADLLNFNEKYIAQLINPLLDGRADMVAGHPTINTVDDTFNPFKRFSGERAVFKKDILPLVKKIKESRFGVETLINIHYKSQKKRIKHIALWGLEHPVKLQKYPVHKSARLYISEVRDITMAYLVSYSTIFLIVRESILNLKKVWR